MRRRSEIGSSVGLCRVAVALTLSCGPGHAEESDSNTGGGGGPGGTDSASTGMGNGSESGDMVPTSSGTSGEETTEPPMPALPDACTISRAEGDARVPIDADNLLGLNAYVLTPGQPGAPARVLTVGLESHGSAHINYRARSFAIDELSQVVESQPSLLLTRDGHAMSRLVRLADGANDFAYLYTGDPRGNNLYDTFFSRLDADAWSVGGEALVLPASNPLFIDLVRASTSARLVSTHTTESTDSTPKQQVSGLSLGVLDGGGVPMVGATPLTLRAPEPGSNVRTFWSGDRVAVAMGHNACAADDALCSPHSVVLARPGAPDEHGAAATGFAVTHTFAGLPDTKYVSRPQISTHAGLNFLSWYEGEGPGSVDAHRSLRGLVLDDHGDPIPWPPDAPAPGPISFMADTKMDGWPSLLVSEWGITVAHRTEAPSFVIQHHDFAYQKHGEPIVFEMDSGLAQYPSMVALDHPHVVLLAWGEQVSDALSIHMAWLECGLN